MPGGLTATDRILLGGAAACMLLLAGTTAIMAPPGQEASPVPSIYSPAPGGARAAYLLLEDLHRDVQAWEEPPGGLVASAPGSLLILADPSEAPSAADRKALGEFVMHGGRVLFCGDSIPMFFPDAKVSGPVAGSAGKRFSANFPSAITRDADDIFIRPEVYWGQAAGEGLRLYGDEDSGAVISWRMGEGTVLWWAGATPLTNAGITQSGNLNLFLNSVPAPSRIYWDEYFHGERKSLLSYFQRTPVTWAAGQILLAAVAILFTFSRRNGPVVVPAAVSRLSPLEFVDTMGALYQHAGATSIPVEVCYRDLRLELTRRLGLPPETPDADLTRAAANRPGLDGVALGENLARASRAMSARKLSSSEALAIVQGLERFKEKN